MSKNCLISVDGNIGAGKSTFMAMLKKHNKSINFIAEPLEEWQKEYKGKNILGLLYEDTSRWSYTFQANAFITRVKKYEREFQKNSINVSERSVVSDHFLFAKMLRDDGNFNDIEWNLYLEWYNWILEKHSFAKPTKIIYLRLDPQIAYERIKKRSREEEDPVSFEYIKRLHDYHENWLMKNKDIPVLVLNVDKDFETDPDVFKTLAKNVENFV